MRAASSLDDVGVLGKKQTPLIMEPNTPCRFLLSGWSGGHQSAKLQSQIVAPSLSLEHGAWSPEPGPGWARAPAETLVKRTNSVAHAPHSQTSTSAAVGPSSQSEG